MPAYPTVDDWPRIENGPAEDDLSSLQVMACGCGAGATVLSNGTGAVSNSKPKAPTQFPSASTGRVQGRPCGDAGSHCD